MALAARPGDLVEVDHPPGRPHPAVVLVVHVDELAVVVACGTGTMRPHYDHVAVPQESRAGKALRLRKPTYFYRDGCVELPASRVLRVLEGRCPPDLFRRLQLLMHQRG